MQTECKIIGWSKLDIFWLFMLVGPPCCLVGPPGFLKQQNKRGPYNTNRPSFKKPQNETWSLQQKYVVLTKPICGPT